MVGVLYRIVYTVGGNPVEGVIPSALTYGPISGLRKNRVFWGNGSQGALHDISWPGTARDAFGVPFQIHLNLGGTAGRRVYGFEEPAFEVAGLTITRVDGFPDTGGDPLGDPIGETEPELEPNPARKTTPRPFPPYRPQPLQRPQPQPEPEPLLWPQTPLPTPLPPLVPNLPTPPGFTPTPPVVPSPPATPFTPPTQPLTTPRPKPRPGTPFLPSVNPLTGLRLVPLPLQLPSGVLQPVVTPSGLKIGTPTVQNPNIQITNNTVINQIKIPGGCCPDLWGQKNNMELQRIKRSIGTDGMPVSVPDIIAKDNPIQRSISSLAELHLWQVQQLDSVMGRWPVGIPIPTGTGSTTVGMPNMAEAVAEMVGMMVSQQVTATQILNTSSRALVQAGSATQQAHLAHLVAKANADFLGYENRPTEVDMPLAFDPGKDPFDGLLNESTQKIRGFENTDGQDIKAIFAELLQAAAIIRAVYWRKLDPRGDLRKQLKDQLRGQSDFIDQAAAGDGDDSDWEAYLRAVEEGFRGATGDNTPYNRRPDEGPQIRDRSPGNDQGR